MTYGDDTVASNGFDPDAEDDEFASAEYESNPEFDSEEDADWDEEDEARL